MSDKLKERPGFFTGKHHSDKTKEILSDKMKKYISENKDKFSWYCNHNKSVPCDIFKQKLRELNIDFVEEYSPFIDRHFIMDIAFPEKMIGVEINGNQHYNRNGSLTKYHQDRHDYIESNGWTLFEIHYLAVYNENLMSLINKMLISETIKEFDYTINHNKSKRDKQKDLVMLNNIKKEDKIDKIKNDILNSSITFEKIGWVDPTSKIIGITPQKVNKWMKRHMPNFYEHKCFKRKYAPFV